MRKLELAMGMLVLALAPMVAPLAPGVGVPVPGAEPRLGLYDAGEGTRGPASGCAAAVRLNITVKRAGGPAPPGLEDTMVQGTPAGSFRCGWYTVNLTQGVLRAGLAARAYSWSVCVGGGEGEGRWLMAASACRGATGTSEVPFRNVTVAGTLGTFVTTSCVPQYCAHTTFLFVGPRPGDRGAVVLET